VVVSQLFTVQHTIIQYNKTHDRQALLKAKHCSRIVTVSFSYIYISQGSVATLLVRGGIFNNYFIANFPPSVAVKEF